LGIALLFRVVAIHLPRDLVNLHDPGAVDERGREVVDMWGSSCVGGSLAQETGSPMRGRSTGTMVVGRYRFSFPLFVFGTQHLMHGHFVATLIPTWIPGHLLWAYFIGVAFIATALAIITRQPAFLASALLRVMFLLWVLILHSPRVAASPHIGNEWTSGFVALAMSGSGFAVAGTLRKSK
jgi:hypothetical protein